MTTATTLGFTLLGALLLVGCADGSEDPRGTGSGSGSGGASGSAEHGGEGGSTASNSASGGASTASGASTATASSTASSSATGGSACDGSGDCTNCTNCAAPLCKTKADICDADPDCVAFWTCLGECGGAPQACWGGCAASHPTGADLYESWLVCMNCDSCPSDCAGYWNCS